MRLRYLCGLLLLVATGCISTKNEVEVKPVEIRVTVDVNIKVEMDKDLKNIFKDIDNRQEILQDEGEDEKEGDNT